MTTPAAAEPTIRVLLADDTGDIRELLRLSLEVDGRFAVVGEADDGQAAVEQAVTLRPDALVLDLAMPVLDGLQAIPLVRKLAPATKILVLSGFEAAQMAAAALERGAHAYLEKGTELDALADRLAGIVAAP